MDTNPLKGRMAEALVESIFRRAGYQVARLGRESQVQRLVKLGADEFSPDFLLWKPINGMDSERPLHRLLTVEVKYRVNLADYLRREGDAFLSKVKEQWPNLYFVAVTDNPGDGQSCFQAIDLCRYEKGSEVVTHDLHQLPELDIFRSTVQEYEGLVKQIFPLLSSHAAQGASSTSGSQRQ